jgi:hypothetical protein
MDRRIIEQVFWGIGMSGKSIDWRICLLVAGLSFFAPMAAIASDCNTDTSVVEATPAEIADFFARQEKSVVTFVGYSGAGYQDEAAMLARAASLLQGFDPAGTIVNIGATPDGIGAVYVLAKQRGFTTTGIVSTQAKEYGAGFSDCVDRVFYVEDATWGGFLADGDRLSPTSEAMVASSDLMIGIGGGEVARDELLAARRAGKQVRYFAADMNHARAREKARKKNLPEPTDFRGAAHLLD